MSKVSANGVAGNNTRSKQDGDWMWLNCEFWRSYAWRLTPAAVRVYAVLATHANNTSQTAFLLHQTIMDEAHCTRATVVSASAELEDAGLIATRRSGRSSFYTLLVEVAKSEAECTSDVKLRAHHSSRRCKAQGTSDVKLRAHRSINQTQVTRTNDPAKRVLPFVPRSQKNVDPNDESKAKLAALMQAALIDCIEHHYQIANPSLPPTPWSPRALKMAHDARQRCPTWGRAEWETCIKNRFASDGIAPGEPPENFILQLTKYISGPMNQYGKLKGPDVNPRTAREREVEADFYLPPTDSHPGYRYDHAVSARTNRNRYAGARVEQEINEAYRQQKETGSDPRRRIDPLSLLLDPLRRREETGILLEGKTP